MKENILLDRLHTKKDLKQDFVNDVFLKVFQKFSE